MESIITLQTKISKVFEARKLNAKLREMLLQRLQTIKAEIYVHTHQKEKKIPFNRQDVDLYGMSPSEYSKLAQLFWGKFHIQGEVELDAESIKPIQLTANQKLLLFLHQSKSSRQKALVLSTPVFNPTISDIQSQIAIPIRVRPYSIHDIIRFYIFFKIFGPNFPINSIYPHISSRTMRTVVKSIENDIKKIPSLNSIELTPDDLQEYITNILNHL